jgi:uncharacterized protein (DUF2126 family)
VSPFARIAYAVYGNPNVAGDGYTILWVHLEDGRICLVPHAFLVGQLLAVGNVSLAPPKASLTITPGEAPTVSAGLFPENREYTIEELRESQRKAAHRRVIAAAEADTERKRALCDAGLTPDDTPKETIMRNLLGLGAKVPETVEEFGGPRQVAGDGGRADARCVRKGRTDARPAPRARGARTKLSRLPPRVLPCDGLAGCGDRAGVRRL